MLRPHELLQVIEEGVANGRIAPHLAAYIAAELQRGGAQPSDHEKQPAADERASR